MIQKGTYIKVKDNSGVLSGKCINTYKKRVAAYGELLTLGATKVKTKLGGSKKNAFKAQPQKQALLVIQSRKLVCRLDGSSLKFNSNCGVTISKSGLKPQLGFKRINTCVPFELKKHNAGIPFGNNLIKLAKNLA